MPSLLVLTLAFMFAPANWLTYTDPADRFTVQYPDTWERSMQGEFVTLLSPVESDSDRFRENVNVVIQDLSATPTTMAEYTRSTKDWVKEKGGTVQLEREIQFAGNTATEMAYTMPPKSVGIDFDLLFHQVWILKDAKAYLLTYTAEPGNNATFEPEAAQIFKSFVLKK